MNAVRNGSLDFPKGYAVSFIGFREIVSDRVCSWRVARLGSLFYRCQTFVSWSI